MSPSLSRQHPARLPACSRLPRRAKPFGGQSCRPSSQDAWGPLTHARSQKDKNVTALGGSFGNRSPEAPENSSFDLFCSIVSQKDSSAKRINYNDRKVGDSCIYLGTARAPSDSTHLALATSRHGRAQISHSADAARPPAGGMHRLSARRRHPAPWTPRLGVSPLPEPFPHRQGRQTQPGRCPGVAAGATRLRQRAATRPYKLKNAWNTKELRVDLEIALLGLPWFSAPNHHGLILIDRTHVPASPHQQPNHPASPRILPTCPRRSRHASRGQDHQ